MSKLNGQITTLYENIEKVIVGKRNVIELATVTLLSKGHLLLEDVPGLGKTMLARSIAKSLALRYKRIQFTPDLLPSDVTGVSIYNQKTGEFEFMPGPVFTHILLADEINRTTPRTQSSLLEAMEERQVTVDGKTYRLPDIFMVIATQNPIELAGTFPLPEAQLDRFFMRISMGYPSPEQEVAIMEMQAKTHPITALDKVISQDEIKGMQDAIVTVHIDPTIKHYIAALVGATREHAHLQLGASPRGSLALMRAAQALAYLRGLSFVEPHLVKEVAAPVLCHRLIVKPQSRLQGHSAEKLVEEILNTVPAPVAA